MKLFTGVDILQISRIEKSLSNPRFLTRLFGLSEQEQFRERGSKAEFLAGSFCGKEAFSKALGTGIRDFSLREVEVLRDPLGKPYYRLSGRAAALARERGLSFDVSISHDGGFVVAYAVAWETE